MNIIDKYKKLYFGAFNGSSDDDTVNSILNEYNIENTLYRSWLKETGGGPIGSDWYDGIDEITESQVKLAKEPWEISGFVIGWDGAGNPIVMQPNGEILTEDHNFGGIHKLAESFDALLAKNVTS